MAETTTKEDIRIDADEADELNREAADDLERIERAVKQEAEEYVEAVDGDGNEKESVEAAATAFDFDEAEGETERLANDASERDSPFPAAQRARRCDAGVAKGARSGSPGASCAPCARTVAAPFSPGSRRRAPHP